MFERRESLSPTDLAAYHHLNCDLYLHNAYYRKVRPTTILETPERPRGQPLAASQFKRGLDWESTLYSWLDDSGLLLTVPGIHIQADVLLENILADERNYFFITGITFPAPQHGFRQRFAAAGVEPVNFGVAKPDLLEVRRGEAGIVWKVVDAKASKTVKVWALQAHSVCTMR